MFDKIIAFFMAIIAFFASLFGINTNSSKVYTYRDLSYGSDKNQAVDLFIPKTASDNMGLFVDIHGGAWIGGDKSGDDKACENIAANYNYAAMTINYRMFGYPQEGQTVESIAADPNSLDMEDMIDDITAAINVAVAKAAENGSKITNACLVGYSAGGHLAMIYAYKYRAQSPVNIAFCVSYVGPADLTDSKFCINTPEGGIGDETALYLASRLSHTYVTEENFGDAGIQAALQSVSPLYYADKAVPTIMAYGMKDVLVPFEGSQRLDAKLTEYGVRHDYFVYPNSGHGLDNETDANTMGDSVYTALARYAKDYFGY